MWSSLCSPLPSHTAPFFPTLFTIACRSPQDLPPMAFLHLAPVLRAQGCTHTSAPPCMSLRVRLDLASRHGSGAATACRHIRTQWSGTRGSGSLWSPVRVAFREGFSLSGHNVIPSCLPGKDTVLPCMLLDGSTITSQIGWLRHSSTEWPSTKRTRDGSSNANTGYSLLAPPSF
jgi:hypothetical protein